MSCVLNLVIFAVLWQKVTLYPTDSTPYTIETTTLDYVISMGQSIEDIPSGKPTIRTLNLAYNQISCLPELVFQNNSYKSLTTIKLNQNRISNIHVTAFRGLKQLTTVVLSDNNVTSLDPFTFKFNTNLQKMDISRNKITLSRLRVFLVSDSLETLTLTKNRIEQIYELSFVKLPNLKNLILDENSLCWVAPKSFESLSKLQYLSLANTGVYHLSESMFGNNLPRIIDLQETPLARIFNPPLKKITNREVKNLLLLLENSAFINKAV